MLNTIGGHFLQRKALVRPERARHAVDLPTFETAKAKYVRRSLHRLHVALWFFYIRRLFANNITIRNEFTLGEIVPVKM